MGYRASLVLLLGLSFLGCDSIGSEGAPSSTADKEEASIYGGPIPPNSSLREILQHPDIFQRTQHIARLFQTATPEQLDDILYEFDTAALDRGDVEYALFASWWARFDPMAAYVHADGQIRMEQPRIQTEVIRTWAHSDPTGLIESGALTSLSTQMRGFRTGLVDAMVVGWFESGQPGLEDYILGLTDSEARAAALHAWVRMRVLRDGDTATLEWTQQVAYHAGVKRNLLAGALSIIAHQNPELCIEWLEKAEAEGIEVATFVPRIANAWGHHDPRAAIDWVLDYSNSQERFRAIQRISHKWQKRDAAGMLKWLFSHADRLGDRTIDLLRTQTLQAYVEQRDYRVDWAQFMESLSEIRVKRKRDLLMLWVLQHWTVADPSGAGAWADANQHDLPQAILDRAKALAPAGRKKMETALGLQSDG